MKRSTRWTIAGACLLVVGGAFFIILLFPLLYAKTSAEALGKPKELFEERSERTAHDNEQEATTGQSEQNRIHIPSIGVDMPIVEGETEAALDRGAWRYPFSSNPEKNGNMVIVGHRFQFGKAHARSFYLFHRVNIGDHILVVWNGTGYVYEVREIREVEPDDLSILESDETKKLTLYTCTPLFTVLRRLVIVATPLAQSPNEE